MERNLFSTKGRISRSVFWTRFISLGILVWISSRITVAMPLPLGLNIFYSGICILSVICGIIQGFKRMHDIGMSGIVFLIPIYQLVLAFIKGDKGSNEYGENPKEKHPHFDATVAILFFIFVPCAVYAFLDVTKIVSDLTVIFYIALLLFTVFIGCYYYLLYLSAKRDRSEDTPLSQI